MIAVLAIDIGASGGRHILGVEHNGEIQTHEVCRFENNAVLRGGTLCWDTDALFSNIKAGMKRCAELGKIPVSVGIDTWGVDFTLLDGQGKRLGQTAAYRDKRTEGMDGKVHAIIPEEEHYRRTGVQRQSYNTIYQLMAVKTQTPELLEQAQRLLFTPDYLHYRLSGVKASEFTIASTSGLINAARKDWDDEVINRLGFPRKLFGSLSQPGTVLGSLTKAVRDEVGYDCAVVLPPSHDTASAYAAVREEDHIILSSGTWSLMGIQLPEPILTEQARLAGLTNEGGADGKTRLLKNIMGLWMIQSIKRELGRSFVKLQKMARESDYEGVVDVNDHCFFAPPSMTAAVAEKCVEGGYPPPRTDGDRVRCIYRSLARMYAQTAKELAELTGKAFKGIVLVGGGSKDALLHELTSRECGMDVKIGQTEATAMGSIFCQLRAMEGR
ncbi:MAG: rhamnulokinase [Oscillospiraceae bacterium]|nr:rhamnulokinase [Oscillospiraceae bacterium]